MIIKRRKSFIAEIKQEDGAWFENKKDIGDYFIDQFDDYSNQISPNFLKTWRI